MAAGCFSVCSAGALLPSLIQGEQLMALVALSCQWSRARLCACSVRFFYGEEAHEWSLPPLLSDSVWEGKVWCIGGDREAARTRSGVERQFDSLRLWPPKDQLRPSSSSSPPSSFQPAVIRTSRCIDSGPRRSARRTTGEDVWLSGQEEHPPHHSECWDVLMLK